MNLKYNWLMVFKNFFFLGGILLCLLLPSVTKAQLPDHIVAVANNAGLTAPLSFKALTAYAKGENNFWPNSNKVIICLPSSKSDLIDDVARAIYKTNAVGLQKYWLALVFQGRSDPPVFFNSDEELIKFLQKNKGALGFIHETNKAKASEYILELK